MCAVGGVSLLRQPRRASFSATSVTDSSRTPTQLGRCHTSPRNVKHESGTACHVSVPDEHPNEQCGRVLTQCGRERAGAIPGVIAGVISGALPGAARRIFSTQPRRTARSQGRNQTRQSHETKSAARLGERNELAGLFVKSWAADGPREAEKGRQPTTNSER